MSENTKNSSSAVILAAGRGERIGGLPKQFLKLCGKPLIAHSLETFQKCAAIREIIIAAPANHIERVGEIMEKFGIGKARIIAGGKTRFESARLGFEQTGDDCEVIVFHDAARPFVSEESISAVISAALGFGAATTAIPLDDTIKKTLAPSRKRADGRILLKNIPRSEVWRVQTPQAFRKKLLGEIYENFSGDPSEITDETSLFEGSGHEVVIKGGKRQNMKITTGEDFIIAEAMGQNIKKGIFTEADGAA